MIQMEQSMRWYGPHDPFGLAEIRQAGCTGVVTALHHIPYGDVWTVEEIQKGRGIVESAGLTWTVIESLPVHDDIKRQTGDWQRYINNYKTSLRNVAACGLKVVTYNFMPVLDWIRTDVAFRMEDGSEALRFEKSAFIAFDLYQLQRPNAADDYTEAEIDSARLLFDSLSQDARDRLFGNLLLGLPGSDEAFTPDKVLEALSAYEGIDTGRLKEHLFHFLREVTPVAEEVGLQLAIHPDDPPFPVLGLPRILSTAKDVRDLFAAVPESANGLCFCTGSFGARGENDIISMLREFGDRVHFLHLRNTKRDGSGNFYEADHLAGDTDMVAVIKEVVALMRQSGRSIPMRPDHGHRMLGDLTRDFYPGYSGIGRLKGLAELRGVEAAFLASATG